jgi:hypothetical protein
MSEAEYDIRSLIARLKMAHIQGYLLNQGWEQKPSQYEGQLYFEGNIHEGEEAYELYLPSSTSAARYQTHLMRAIYKLCGIEDREPAEIARDMLASSVAVNKVEAVASATRVRARNSGSTPLRLQIDSPFREHVMLPGESIELLCHMDANGLLEIDREDGSLIVRCPKRSP